MTATITLPSPQGIALPEGARRIVVYATSRLRGRLDDYVPVALDALRPFAGRLVIVACGEPDDAARERLGLLCDKLILHPAEFTPEVYARALADQDALLDFDEVVLTGDSWFGPTADFAPVLARMGEQPVHFWEMIENRHGVPRSFPEQGFPPRLEPWTWTVARRELVASDEWTRYWAARRTSTAALEQESGFASHFRTSGYVGGAAFAADNFSTDDPGLFAADLLVAAGCPLVKRIPFTLYPPLLHQHAIIGRDIVAAIEESGYDPALLWQHLARTVPPKALNANAGMLEIPAGKIVPSNAPSRRIVAVAHISDVDQAGEILRRLATLPTGADLVVTTSDGRKAMALTRLFQRAHGLDFASVDVRVTPASRGRDMSDFFVACRDVLAGGRYDIVVKVHARPKRGKTVNVRRYFRRYQLENLLGSKEHVAAILALFEQEPGLGLVFPPMMHIGYATMGWAWGEYREAAEQLFAELGIAVPVDRISPLAPFGGMWFARPEALRLLAEQRWLYRDYGKPGRKKYRDLARLQERAVAYAAGELGYHSRTVLTPEHASISHTALEFKADQLSATMRGYPLDQILLIQRAGPTGYGGIVGLSRMYLRLNHPMLARFLHPLFAAAQWGYVSVRALMGHERFIKQRETWRDEDL